MNFNEYSLEKKSELTALADSVRSKSGAVGNLTVPQIKAEVDNISTGTHLPTLSNPGVASELMNGKELIDASGNKVTGTFSLDDELSAQDNLIAQIKTALQGKAAGIAPSGTLEISENGTYDVSSYASANVDVASGGDTTLGERLIARTSANYSNPITIPDGITEIGAYAFYYYKKMQSVVIPNSVTTIGVSAFQHSGLSGIIIPDSVTTIGTSAFANCGNLFGITIPQNVTDIGLSAFVGSSLETVTFKGTPSVIGVNVFNVLYDLTDIYVPWSEGAVVGAPWGAPNATIHYNSEV